MILSKNLNNSNLLIVGGTGFIGLHVTKKSLKNGFKVTVISKNNYPQNKQINGVDYINVDISREKDLHHILKDRVFEYVLNLGGYVDHKNFSEGGKEVFETHFSGTLNLVKSINKDTLKSFIQIGSSDEYGANIAPQKENQREMPISPYSIAKTSATHFLQMLYRTERFPVVILRLFLVYGPGQDCGRFLPQIIKGCFSGKEFETSAGEQLRDFCYIDDITDGILRAIKSDNVNGEIINLASGDPISIRTVIEKVQTYIGKGNPKFGKIAYRTGENMILYADTSKAKQLLGWRSKTAIEDGIKKTVEHYRSYDLK
jgi:nucleoside-diphosphate-sugar epimerase